MNFQTKYNLCLWKGYFDKGLGLTSYFKYIIALFALSSLNIRLTLIFGFFYGILCFVLGFFWYKFGWIKAEMEVSNKFNLFVEEVRQKLKRRKI